MKSQRRAPEIIEPGLVKSLSTSIWCHFVTNQINEPLFCELFHPSAFISHLNITLRFHLREKEKHPCAKGKKDNVVGEKQKGNVPRHVGSALRTGFEERFTPTVGSAAELLFVLGGATFW